jgi:hypothetical protein
MVVINGFSNNNIQVDDEHVELSIIIFCTFILLFIFWLGKALNPGLHVCIADSLPLEPHSSLFCFGYIWRHTLMKYVHFTKNIEI